MEQEIVISTKKRKELENAIQRITIEQYSSIRWLLKKYIDALLNLPEVLHPFLPESNKVPISINYILSDRIRSVRIDDEQTYELDPIRELEVLCSYNDEITDAVEKYNSVKAEIIREIPSFTYIKWPGKEIKLEHGKLRYYSFTEKSFDDLNFIMEYTPYDRLDCVVLSDLLRRDEKEYEPKDISRLVYHYESTGNFPLLDIYGIIKNRSKMWESRIFSTGKYYNDWKIYDFSLELYPMADKLIEFFKDMEVGLNEYKKEFEKCLKRLEDINAMYEFKEMVDRFKE